MANNFDDILNKIDDKLNSLSESVYKIDKDVALQKAALEEHIKQDDRMFEEFKRMNDILQQNTDSLKEHMRRTEILEEILTKMDSRISPIEMDRLEDRIIKRHKESKLKKYGKIIGVVTAIIGALAGIKPFFIKFLSN